MDLDAHVEKLIKNGDLVGLTDKELHEQAVALAVYWRFADERGLRL
jgi:hypothetical protein